MIKVFFDSSVIVAAALSKIGASRQVLTYCEQSFIQGWTSDQAISEIELVIKRKFPDLKADFESIFKIANLQILHKVRPNFLSKARGWIKDKNDVHILAAAKQLDVEVLLTLDLRHFIKDLEVSKKSGLKIMTPGEFVRGFIKYT